MSTSPDLARPIAPHRVRAYLAVLFLTGFVFAFMTVAEAAGWLGTSRTVDVVANVIFGVPVAVIPLVYFWSGRGEERPPLQRAAELTLVYLPYTAGSQLGYELPFLLGHPFDAFPQDLTDPGWKWLWWQYGQADQRYTSDNPWIFGLEFWSVIAGLVMAVAWSQLLRVDLPDRLRLRYMWLALLGVTSLLGTATAYISSEVRAGFDDIGQGAYGLWFKFVFENVFYFVMPYAAVAAMIYVITQLIRRGAVADLTADPGEQVRSGVR